MRRLLVVWYGRSREGSRKHYVQQKRVAVAQERSNKKYCSRGGAFRVGDLVRLKLSPAERHKKGGKKMAHYQSYHYHVIKVLRGGWSYKLIPESDPAGRVKVRHFDELESATVRPYSWGIPLSEQPSVPANSEENTVQPSLRRSKRFRQPPYQLQVDPGRRRYKPDQEECWDGTTDDEMSWKMRRVVVTSTSDGVVMRSFGSVMHEIAHAIGFWHEHSRSDRDNHIIVNYDNIKDTNIRNFDIKNDNSYGVPYDYHSDLHYSARAFHGNGHITIATKNPLYQGVIGQRTGLSHMDYLLANRMYGCTKKLLASCAIESDPCLNYGYLNPACSCVCPEGTAGPHCDTLITPYDETHLSPYSRMISGEQVITSHNYPSTDPVTYHLGAKYTKLLRAPEGHLVLLKFLDFSLYQRSDDSCDSDRLEIRTSNMVDGDWYCGNEITAGQMFLSEGREMTLYFRSGAVTRGWAAKVTFIPSTTTIVNNHTTTINNNNNQPRTTITNNNHTTITNNNHTTITNNNHTTTIATTTTTPPSSNHPIVVNNHTTTIVVSIHTTIIDSVRCVKLIIEKLRLSPGDEMVVRNPYTPPVV
ncbi:Blastula protease 10-like 1 [Homarus americanus]|uniref:Metalloendopeptidase n=1 Tax=Homarus americanus TaxID=6706 RepID=A0A8J5JXZ1_HOMAM|nr:Blastula protease 10-like 1 [Homarus americanus]